ncbi:uncharacterized protein Drep2 isoform X2 [Lepeophtheirus salmonis]
MIEAIPPIVTETLVSLGLIDQIPSWKIMDNKGKVTVVLHWERGLDGNSTTSITPRKSSSYTTLAASSGPRVLPSRSISQRSTPCLSRDNSRNSSGGSALQTHSSLLFQSSFDSNKDQRFIETNTNRSLSNSAQVSLINPEDGIPLSKLQQSTRGNILHFPTIPGNNHKGSSIITGAPRVLSRQGSSVESGSIVPIHFHTPECCAPGRFLHQPTSHSKRGSPPRSSSVECDFHCCSLHVVSSGEQFQEKEEQGRSKYINTCLTENEDCAPVINSHSSDGKKSHLKGAHVRFCNIDGENMSVVGNSSSSYRQKDGKSLNSTQESSKLSNGSSQTAMFSSQYHPTLLFEALTTQSSMSNRQNSGSSSHDSSESETDLYDEHDQKACSKFLLLVDSPSTSIETTNSSHLSIKDIGIILERLNSKILDVEKLDREIITDKKVYNWTIKATIKGEDLCEIGVIYNNNYYSIGEHPGYQNEAISNESIKDKIISEEDVSEKIIE